MDTAQWPQEIVVKPIEEIVTNSYTKPIPNINNNNNNNNNSNSLERKLTRPQKDQQTLKNCPRCNSTNTKFCYYNNYSLTQPRYFCKTCRRYWTEGGSLRNIPVGGGSRKNKRPSSSSPSPASTSSKIMVTKLPDLVNPNHPNNNNGNSHSKTMMMSQGQDLNLGFPNSSTNNTTGTSTTATHDFRHISDLVQLPNIDQNGNSGKSNPSNHISALELLTGFTSRGFNSFMPMPVIVPDHHHHHHPSSVYGPTATSTSGFSLPLEFKPSLNFSLDGAGYGGLQESNNNGGTTNGRLLFPFEDLKQVSEGSNGIEQSNSKEQGDSTTGYWSGMLGGANW